MKLLKITLFTVSFIYFQGAGAQSWTTLNPAQACINRHESALVAIGDKVVLLGGRGIKPVEVFDTKTQTWTRKSETPMEFHHFQAVVFKGEIYVMAAFTDTKSFPHEKPVEHIYIYNLEKDTWRKGPELPKNRLRGAAGCAVYKNKIYVLGGSRDGHWDGYQAWLDEYDPSTNAWRQLSDAPRARDHVSIGIVNDKLYVAGGRRTSGKTGKYLNHTEAAVDVYDFAANSWKTLPENLNIPTQRAGSSAVVMGQKIIVIGGESSVQEAAHAEVEAFDTKKMKWEKLPALQRGRHGTGAALINGKIYTAAGSGNRGGSPELNSVEVFK